MASRRKKVAWLWLCSWNTLFADECIHQVLFYVHDSEWLWFHKLGSPFTLRQYSTSCHWAQRRVQVTLDCPISLVCRTEKLPNQEFPGASVVNNLPSNAGISGLIPDRGNWDLTCLKLLSWCSPNYWAPPSTTRECMHYKEGNPQDGRKITPAGTKTQGRQINKYWHLYKIYF